MKVDRLFLEKDCPDCGPIRAALNQEAAAQDKFRGPEKQSLHVFATLSNEASIELLKKFGLEGKFMPVLVKADGTIVEKPDRILSHLRQNGMAEN